MQLHAHVKLWEKTVKVLVSRKSKHYSCARRRGDPYGEISPKPGYNMWLTNVSSNLWPERKRKYASLCLYWLQHYRQRATLSHAIEVVRKLSYFQMSIAATVNTCKVIEEDRGFRMFCLDSHTQSMNLSLWKITAPRWMALKSSWLILRRGRYVDPLFWQVHDLHFMCI